VSARDLEIDAKTFLDRLPPQAKQWCKLVTIDEYEKYNEAVVFIYDQPKDIRIAQIDKSGNIIKESEKTQDTASYVSAGNLRLLVDAVCKSQHPFPILLVEIQSLYDPQRYGLFDPAKFSKARPIFGELSAFFGATAWIKNGKVFVTRSVTLPSLNRISLLN
jgi:hypothetical protein